MDPRKLRPAASLLVLALALPVTGCFEPPVREAVVLSFSAGGGLEVRVSTWLEAESLYGSRPRARDRIAAAREAARCGDDAWSRQLELLSPGSLRRSLLSRDGALREVTLTAGFADARAVERLFEPHPLSVSLVRGEESTQLEILPGRASRAAPGERREVDQALDRFAVAAASYLAALADLYAYLDAAPARERPVFSELLSTPGAGPEGEKPPESEKALLETLEEAMAQVHGFLRLDEGRGESLDEVSRRVYDPFPAPLAVEVAGRVEEVTGFVRDAEGRYRVPSAGLLGTLATLSGRWVRPDPLAALVEAEERPGTTVDVDTFLAGGRAVLRRPAVEEVREAIEKGLSPQPAYRLRWIPAPAGQRPR